ncbi:Uncharacterised protein [Mycobacteroides abscessus subsp. abscessus]|nr:Uncharacterised protein [Mycobacteroides abscessus subsp. abscessus]
MITPAASTASWLPISAMMSTPACPPELMRADTMPPAPGAWVLTAAPAADAPAWIAALATAFAIGTMTFSMMYLISASITILRIRMRSCAASSSLVDERSTSAEVSFIRRPLASNASKSPRN